MRRQCSREVHSYESAICGSFSGAIAAAVTTPLDVMKTRLMLGEVCTALCVCYSRSYQRRLFTGFITFPVHSFIHSLFLYTGFPRSAV